MVDHKSGAVAVRPALRLLPLIADGPEPDAQSGPAPPPLADSIAPDLPPQKLLGAKGIAYLPSEDVLLLTVALPKMAAAQRRSAVAFAIEDLIAQPLDQVHVVLGPEGRDEGNTGAWLVAVVSNSVMADHIAAQPQDTGILIPDVLAMQVPVAGEWSVLALQDRILVRLPDRSGFATTPAMLSVLWQAGGAPKVVLLGGTLPPDVPVSTQAGLAAAVDPALLGFDLRSGRFARRGAGLPKGLRAVGLILALAVVGHLILLALDVMGLERIAASREQALRTALQAQGQGGDGDIDSALTAALAAQQPATSGDFLPLLAQAFGAIAPQTGQVQIKDMRFVQAQNSLALTVEAPDLAALQTVETAFAEAGLRVDAGAATTGDGAAEAQMTLSRGAP